MYEALMEIMEPDVRIRIEEGVQRGIERGIAQGMERCMRKGIRNTIELLREFGHEDPEIRKAIMKKYGLSSEKAEEYL